MEVYEAHYFFYIIANNYSKKYLQEVKLCNVHLHAFYKLEVSNYDEQGENRIGRHGFV